MSDTIAVSKEFPESQIKVPLSMIYNKKYRNSRKDFSSESAVSRLREIMDNIRVHGQLQSVIGAYSSDGKQIDLVGGFRRYEAFSQIALKKLVKEYNEVHGFKAGDDGFIDLAQQASREKIMVDTSPVPAPAGTEATAVPVTWAAKYKEAMDAVMIKVDTSPVTGEADAAYKNLSENTARANLTTHELCDQIIYLIGLGEKQKTIGQKLGKSEGKISQCIKIAGNPEYLRTFFTLESTKVKLPDVSKKMLDEATAAIAELERRMALPDPDPACISFSHLRELAFASQTEKVEQKISAGPLLKLLKDLVRLKNDGTKSDVATMDYDIFKAKLADAKQESKLADVPAAATATPAGTTPIAPVQPAGTTVGDLAGQQQKSEQLAAETSANAAAATAASEEALSVDDLIGGVATTTGAPTVTTAPSGATVAANAPEGTVPSEAKAGPSAETKTSVQEAPASSYKPMEFKSMEIMANDYIAALADESSTMLDAATFLFSSMTIFDNLGMNDMSIKVNRVYGAYIDGLAKYLNELEKFVADKSKVQDVDRDFLNSVKPAQPRGI